jgi:hypothetical protein
MVSIAWCTALILDERVDTINRPDPRAIAKRQKHS